MHDGSNNANDGNIAHFYAEYIGREDVQLMAIAAIRSQVRIKFYN